MPSENIRPGTTIRIFESFKADVPDDWLQQITERVLAAARDQSIITAGEANETLGLVIADDDTVKDLNRRHRGLDETTDVLAFSPWHAGAFYGDERPQPPPPDGINFVTPPDQEVGLGEIIISYPQAVKQAMESGHEVTQELAALLVHGVLHLVGYDHMDPDEEAAMKTLESAVLFRVLSNE